MESEAFHKWQSQVPMDRDATKYLSLQPSRIQPSVKNIIVLSAAGG